MTSDRWAGMSAREQVSFVWAGGCVVVRLTGRVDQPLVQRIRGRVDEVVAMATVGPVTIDLTRATSLDPAGVGMIVALQERTRDALGTLTVAGATATIRDSLAVAGLDKAISVG